VPFAACYRNEVDAPDWVCVGVARNDSLNSIVCLRCAGKRWWLEDEKNLSEFLPNRAEPHDLEEPDRPTVRLTTQQRGT
jgi:hypothetical protein